MLSKKTIGYLAGLVFLAVAFSLSAGIPLRWETLGSPDSPAHRILWELRLPRTFFVFFAGASLAAVGAVYQILFYNALAEPYLLGISSAATLGMASAEVFFGIAATSVFSQSIGLFCASWMTAALLGISLSHRGSQTERIALFGVGANFVLSSILFLVLSYHSQQVGGGALRWLFGQIPWLGGADVLRFSVVAASLLACLVCFSRSLDAIAFGDGVAHSLGFSPYRIRFLFLAITSVLVAWLASFTGSIGFIGLVVPHFIRLVFRPSQNRALLLLCIPVGGSFLMLSDSISRSLLPPIEFPVGVVTTLLGGPLFLFLLWKK